MLWQHCCGNTNYNKGHTSPDVVSAVTNDALKRQSASILAGYRNSSKSTTEEMINVTFASFDRLARLSSMK